VSANTLLKSASYQKKCKINPLVQPFLKWAGGKRQLLSEIRKYVPKKFNNYIEPFLGGGAVLFGLQPQRAIVNDINSELINLYNVIKAYPDELSKAAKQHQTHVTEEYFYKLRSQDRDKGFASLSSVEKASRIIFLNKTCYNGLFRVNRQGQFNVPFGNYVNPIIVDEIVIRAVSHYLNNAEIELMNCDFEDVLAKAKKGDFVYLDPPYDPISDTSSFTGYNLENFGKKDQRRLKEICDKLTRRHCKIIQSNSATDFIRELYSDTKHYKLIEVEAKRNINSRASGRGKISELLILNNHISE
jgi:DNA adenine methylase